MVNIIFKYKSLISLILANLVPLFGVLFWGWDIFSMLILYWIESFIIGIWNVPKIIKASGGFPKYIPTISDIKTRLSWQFSYILLRIFFIVFFVFQYGIFMYGYIMFFLKMISFESLTFFPTFSTPLVAFQNIEGFWIAAASVFISHGFSFFHNYIGKKEYECISPTAQMFQPYKRIVVMHITLLIGAVLFFFLGNSSIGFLIVFWALKMFLDVRAHLKEREKFSGRLGEIEQNIKTLI